MLKTKTQRKKRKIKLLKQKMLGLAICTFSIIAVPIMDGDATSSVLALPMGLYVLFTKEKVTDFDE